VSTKSEADLSFKVGGIVTRVLVDDGARVRKGQLLATLDATELQAAHSQSSSSAAKAERDLERVKRLLDSGAVGTVDAQNADTAAAVARATAESAEFNLKHAQLLAPDDGIIDRRVLEVGEIAAPGRPVFHLRGSSRGVIVRCAVTDRDALRLRQGDLAQVRLDARPEVAYPARVSQLAIAATAGTGTFEVELRLQAPEAARWPSGLTAKVELPRSEQPSATIPFGALVDGDGDSAAVFVLDGERVRRVPVTISFLQGDRAALARGLEQIEQVVESGADLLEDGALVHVIAPKRASEGTADAH
jgi:RND family efflux transporter MFP subunit